MMSDLEATNTVPVRTIYDDSGQAIGPILRFEGTGKGVVHFAVTRMGSQEPIAARVRACDGDAGQWDEHDFEPIGKLAGTAFWTCRFAVPSTADAFEIDAGEGPTIVRVPRPNGPLRVAFASCNGAEDPLTMTGLPGGRNALWRRLAERHAAAPFHLLVLDGDQIYADGLWDLPTMRAWSALPRTSRFAVPFTDAMRAELERHYLDTYAEAFGSPDVRVTLGTIPTLMVWDDHDIVDGWGSRPTRWQASPVAQGLFDVARRAFALVQAGIAPDRTGDATFDRADDYGPARIVVPDLRSTRTRRRVMDEAGRAALREGVLSDREHLLVVSSVPLLNADLSPVERVVAPFQPLADLFQDDLRDQWMSYAHRAEWRRTVDLLIERAVAGRRVSVVSGEIHLAARAVLHLRDDGSAGDGAPSVRVDQFIASGIAHPPPPRALAALFERFGGRRRRGRFDVVLEPVTPDGRRFLPERNWLEIELAPDAPPVATVHAEHAGRLSV